MYCYLRKKKKKSLTFGQLVSSKPRQISLAFFLFSLVHSYLRLHFSAGSFLLFLNNPDVFLLQSQCQYPGSLLLCFWQSKDNPDKSKQHKLVIVFSREPPNHKRHQVTYHGVCYVLHTLSHSRCGWGVIVGRNLLKLLQHFMCVCEKIKFFFCRRIKSLRFSELQLFSLIFFFLSWQ